MIFAARVQLSPNPSLVLAPESALRLLPSRALFSAPVACSVFKRAIICNYGTKKTVDVRSAFRHVAHQGAKREAITDDRRFGPFL
jgi:hypothetical protein